MPDDAREIDTAIAGAIEGLVNFLRVFAKWRGRAGGLRSFLRQR